MAVNELAAEFGDSNGINAEPNGLDASLLLENCEVVSSGSNTNGTVGEEDGVRRGRSPRSQLRVAATMPEIGFQ